MKRAHKKRPPRATANSPPVLPDIGKLLYKSVKFTKENIPSLLNDLYTIETENSILFIFLLHNILYLR